MLAAPVVADALLSGCGAGQISQTDQMIPAVPGANANSPHGLASVRNVMIRYNSPTGYPAGGTAPLVVYIVNNSRDKTLTLRSVLAAVKEKGDPLGTVVLAGGAAEIHANPHP